MSLEFRRIILFNNARESVSRRDARILYLRRYEWSIVIRIPAHSAHNPHFIRTWLKLEVTHISSDETGERNGKNAFSRSRVPFAVVVVVVGDALCESILLFSSKWQLLHDFLQSILLSLWCTHTQSVRVDWYVNSVGLFLCLISATFSVTFKRTGKVDERNTRKIASPTVAAACQCRSLKAFRSLNNIKVMIHGD